jgi:quercetin dioxygenase-like cupin family protein
MATAPKSEVLHIAELASYQEGSVVSRQITKDDAGNVTLFAFDEGQGLTEHTSPFEALVMVLDGALTLTIGGTPVRATPGTVVRMPAGVPHGVEAPEPARMLLVMLRDA